MKILFCCLFLISCSSKSWRDASRESAGIAKKAELQKQDIFQIYYARAYSWRGYFAVHPWIAWKKSTDKEYSVAQVTSWNLRRTKSTAISLKKDLPDRNWFGSTPTLLFEAKGKKAEVIIGQVQKLIENYPFKSQYRIWPGPNSNTFVAYLIQNIKEIKIELPAHAIGKDYLGPSEFITSGPSGTGFQASLFGLLGLSMGLGEGVEVNLLGLNFGIDIWTPAIKIPFIGRLGFADKPID